ncbi:uncharacterized protein LOC128326693 isoform X3 [Hemicordylus capensis]|uniref:uncharacterized protein LOC128326693 isoform X3 n=1 Tax=Hemicordylus capensis TaxID=884348 RepID=UPI002302799F|nr:uncharacterized protein LOC128326693 isoform X3 [Hemicordylus capensis]
MEKTQRRNREEEEITRPAPESIENTKMGERNVKRNHVSTSGEEQLALKKTIAGYPADETHPDAHCWLVDSSTLSNYVEQFAALAALVKIIKRSEVEHRQLRILAGCRVDIDKWFGSIADMDAVSFFFFF